MVSLLANAGVQVLGENKVDHTAKNLLRPICWEPTVICATKGDMRSVTGPGTISSGSNDKRCRLGYRVACHMPFGMWGCQMPNEGVLGPGISQRERHSQWGQGHRRGQQ